MFTGIVTAVGEIASVESKGEWRRLEVKAPRLRLGAGESVAVDGVCLTALRSATGRFHAELSAETLKRTCLGARAVGDRVNLERCLRPSDRFGGHIVQGHVDCRGRVLGLEVAGDDASLVVGFPVRYSVLVAEKGSVAINGVSLTVAKAGPGRLAIALIPYTLGATNLGTLTRGDRVNLEFDYLAKLVGRWLEFHRGAAGARPRSRRRRTGGVQLD